MGIIMCKNLLSFFVLFISLNLYAQKSNEVIKIDGVKYYTHIVEQGHTLYAISKVYSVDIEYIIAANPGVENGLSIGERILIPVKKVNKKQKKKNPPKLIDGKLVHTVKERETLYGIASKYKLSVEELVKQNPQVGDGLKEGMQLIISQVGVSDVSEEEITPALPENFIQHEVLPKETLYSISKIYGIGIDSIVSINPVLVDGLKAGMLIYIPLTPEEHITQLQDEGIIYSPSFNEKYNIALFLPFDFDATDTLIVEHVLRKKSLKFSQNTMVSLEFYRGFLLALDSLKKKGLNATLFVYDLGKNMEKAREYANDPNLKSMDLIVGPFHLSGFEVISDFAHKNKIKIICPISHPIKVLTDKPEVIETTPSQVSQIHFLTDYFFATKENSRFISISYDDAKSKIIGDEFKDYTRDKNLQVKNLIIDPQSDTEIEYLLTALDSTRLNRIFIASVNDGFIVPLFNRMMAIDTAVYKIQVYGLNDLYHSGQINTFYRHRYNLTLVLTNYIRYDDPQTIDFIEKYRKLYLTDPSASGFVLRGYDVGMFFMEQFLENGVHFTMIFDKTGEWNGLQSKFYFKQLNSNSGYENKDMYLVKYKNYDLKEVEVDLFDKDTIPVKPDSIPPAPEYKFPQNKTE